MRHDEPEAARLEKLVNQADAPKPLGGVALWYVKQGWPVFPLLPNQKVPATRNGFKDATIDEDRIRAWWTRHPDSNIGLQTGVKFDVIDIDGPEGIKSLSELSEDKIPPVHGKVGTPRGFHLYVQVDENSGNKAGIFPGIDYRGKGGYVVAPPSQIDFKHYKWIMQPSPHLRKT
ncbi:bifunctional DNA primase/polymerase [Mycolicibacterium sp. S2-37]|nr:bifunctional DNA primase/polymerase [Mycolicibacterium sp. S2-37]